MSKRCLDCTALIATGSRCPRCSAILRQRRGGSGYAEQRARTATIDRLGRVCAACGATTTDAAGPTRTEVDHRRAVANGGETAPANLQILCRRCNRRKGAQ